MNWNVLAATGGITTTILIIATIYWWIFNEEENRKMATFCMTLGTSIVLAIIGVLVGCLIDLVGIVTASGVLGTVIGLPSIWFGGMYVTKNFPSKLAQWWLKEKEVAKLKAPPKFASIDRAFEE